MAPKLPHREPTTLQKLRTLAADSNNIVFKLHGNRRKRERRITPDDVRKCCLKGVIAEERVDHFGLTVVTVERRLAGEEMTCVAAIDWPSKILIITVY